VAALGNEPLTANDGRKVQVGSLKKNEEKRKKKYGSPTEEGVKKKDVSKRIDQFPQIPKRK